MSGYTGFLCRAIMMRIVFISFFAFCYSWAVVAQDRVVSGSGGTMDAAAEEDFSAEFNRSVDDVFPLSPEEIRELRKLYQENKKALNASKPPAEKSRSVPVSLEPDAEAPEILIAPSYISAIEVVDSSGMPWPIRFSAIGSADAFQVIKPENQEPHNVITLSPRLHHGHTNIILGLEGQSTPLSLRIKTDDKISYDRVSLRVDQAGPLAEPVSVGPPPKPSLSRQMKFFLDNTGLSVKGARELAITGNPAELRLWEYEGRYYLRSRYSLLYPPHNNFARNSRVFLYQIPVVEKFMVSKDGHRETYEIIRR